MSPPITSTNSHVRAPADGAVRELSPTSLRSGTGLPRWIWLLAFVPFGALVWKTSFLCDDAFIAFRYSRNFAEGLGLRYNPGTEPPVEGYTQLLWVLWGALIERLGLDITVWSRGTSIAAGAALLVWVTRFCRERLALDPLRTLLVALFFATLPTVNLWSTGGLETMPFALAVFATFERLLGDPERPRPIQAGLCANVVGLMRADGGAWIAAILAVGFVLWLARRRRELIRALWITGAMFAVGTAAYVAWRYWYYGWLLPNTAYAKVSDVGFRYERGIKYAVSYLLVAPTVTFVLVTSVTHFARKQGRALLLSALALAAFAFAYSAYVGGDFMPMGRFLAPAMPFVAVLFAGLLRSVPAIPAAAAAVAAIALSLLSHYDVLVFPRSWLQAVHFRWNRDEVQGELELWARMKERVETWTLQGKALERIARPGESLVANGIGAIGYYSRIYIHDQYGLVNAEVAHRDAPPTRSSPGHDNRVDAVFFLKEKPTYIHLSLLPADAPPPEATEASIGREPFRAEVRLESHPLDPKDGFPPGLVLWVKRLVWQ